MTAARRRPLAAAALLAAAVVWAFLLLHVAHLWDRNSDNSWPLLVGLDFARGDWRLHGWTLSPFSGWLSEVPVYAASIRLGGGSALLYQAPTVIYGLVVTAATGIAALAAPAGRRLLAGLLAFGLVGLTTPFLAYTVLQGGIHVGTTLFAAVALICAAAAARGGTAGTAWAAAAAVLTAAGTASDPLFLVIGALPALAGAAVLALRSPRGPAFVVATAVAAGAAAGQLLRTSGSIRGFAFETLDVGAAPPATWPHHAHLAVEGLGALLGATDWPLPAPLAVALAAFTAAGVAAAALAVLPRLAGAVTPADRARLFLLAALAAACAANLAAFVASTAPVDIFTSRYLQAAVVFGCVLLAAQAVTLPRPAWLLPAGLVAAHVGVFAALVAAPAVAASPSQALARWLATQGLTRGYGPYWDANVITAESGGRVKVRPVVAAGDRLAPFHYASNSRWYEPADGTARFVVFAVDGVPGPAYGFSTVSVTSVTDGVGEAAAAATFGAPDRRVRVGPYEVLVWRAPLPELNG